MPYLLHILTRCALTIAVLAAAAAPLFAVTYLVPEDREMIQRADDIVIATSLSSFVERGVTRYTLAIDEVLKGKRAAGETLTLTEIGGASNGFTLYLSGTPVYVPGKQYLVFTDANADGEPVTWGLELGQFVLEGRFAIRRAVGFDQNWEAVGGERLRDARGFVEYIRGIVAQRIDPRPKYFVEGAPEARTTPSPPQEQVDVGFSRGSFLVMDRPRWRVAPAAALVTSGAQPGADGTAAVHHAIDQWNATDSTIAYGYAGQNDAANGGLKVHDGISAVLFNDPNGELAPPVLARGGPWSQRASYAFDGETFIDIDGGVDVVVDNRSFEQACLNAVITHELGHTLGFRHSNENGELAPPKPCNTLTQLCSNNAMMVSTLTCNASSNATLRSWDLTAAEAVYSTTCIQPAIVAISLPQSTVKGDRVTLNVTASGTETLHYQWYESVESPRPVGTDSPAFTSAPLSASTKFWVKVSNACGDASSSPISIEVKTPKQRAVRH